VLQKFSFVQGLSIIGVQQIDRVVEVVEETLKGNTVRLLGTKKEHGKKIGGAPLLLPKVRRNPLIEIIAINTGCLNQCTYCKTKHARGDLGSYPPEEIVERAKLAFEEGVVEIWLTSEDTGTYGRDIGTSLPELLWKLVEVIPEGCRLRLGMTNPPYILEHLEEISKIMNHPRVYSFLHVPVQSGSDQVLADMKREYCRKDFELVVDFLRSRISGMTVATDIICGFPTETEANFEETISLCEKYKFPSLFINQFFPRPGTPAALLHRIPAQEVKRRTKKINGIILYLSTVQ
jgi:threonylcarbamoyladenosine tRNA methylthiotransferase CDKAL1